MTDSNFVGNSGGSALMKKQMKLAKNPLTAPDALVELVNSGVTWGVVVYALQNPNFPKVELKRQALTEWWFLNAIMGAPELSQGFIRKLSLAAYDRYGEGAWNPIVRNENCPAYTLTRAAFSSNHNDRQLVAEHPNTPEEVVEILAADRNNLVRSSIAARDKFLSRSVVKSLLRDPDIYVRTRLARNKSIPNEWMLPMVNFETNVKVLLVLADRSKKFRGLVVTRLEGMARLGTAASKLIAEWSSSPVVVSRLRSSSNASVRVLASRNKDA